MGKKKKVQPPGNTTGLFSVNLQTTKTTASLGGEGQVLPKTEEEIGKLTERNRVPLRASIWQRIHLINFMEKTSWEEPKEGKNSCLQSKSWRTTGHGKVLAHPKSPTRSRNKGTLREAPRSEG